MLILRLEDGYTKSGIDSFMLILRLEDGYTKSGIDSRVGAALFYCRAC